MKIPPVEDQYRLENAADKSCRGNQNAHFMLNNAFQKSCFYEILRENVIEQDKAQMKTWCM
jgi:hypothetical protein